MRRALALLALLAACKDKEPPKPAPAPAESAALAKSDASAVCLPPGVNAFGDAISDRPVPGETLDLIPPDAAAPPTGAITKTKMTVTGVTTDAAESVFREQLPHFKRCYEEIGLRHCPALKGEVSIRLDIEGTQGVRAQQLGSAFPFATIVACMLRPLSKASFPQVDGGRASIVYTIALEPMPAKN